MEVRPYAKGGSNTTYERAVQTLEDYLFVEQENAQWSFNQTLSKKRNSEGWLELEVDLSRVSLEKELRRVSTSSLHLNLSRLYEAAD